MISGHRGVQVTGEYVQVSSDIRSPGGTGHWGVRTGQQLYQVTRGYRSLGNRHRSAVRAGHQGPGVQVRGGTGQRGAQVTGVHVSRGWKAQFDLGCHSVKADFTRQMWVRLIERQ